jgi:predicted nuclease of predicted toxin-antitoxin system
LDLAESESRIVLTLDKDFWQIAVQRRVPLKQSGVVLFRAHPAIPVNLDPLARTLRLSRRIGSDLLTWVKSS